MQRIRGLILVLLLSATLAVGARAQALAPPPAQERLWEFSITPYAWIAGIGGEASARTRRNPTVNLDASFGDIFSHLTCCAVMVGGEMRYSRFILAMDVLNISVRNSFDGITGLHNSGNARVSTTEFSLLGLLRAVDRPEQSLDVGAGFRFWDVRSRFNVDAGRLPADTASPSTSWLDPVIAARYTYRFTPSLGVTAYGDIGGFGAGSRLTWQALGSVDYAVNRWLVLKAGWRYLAIERATDRLRLDLNMNGPFLAATFRF